MKEVFVYVEGPSDQLAMQKLLAPIIERSLHKGDKLDFYSLGGKEPLLNKGTRKAINILRNRPNSWVFLVPDLYPQNKPFPHRTYEELKTEIQTRFIRELKQKKCDSRLEQRFFVHCFKYDLEALLLAADAALLQRLKVTSFSRNWMVPVENQNHNLPPKRIVEELFSLAGQKYKDTADAPWILERVDYKDIERKCPQNFKPFVADLFTILELKESR